MQPKDHDRIAMHRGLRSIFIEASEDELREAFAGTEEDLDAPCSWRQSGCRPWHR